MWDSLDKEPRKAWQKRLQEYRKKKGSYKVNSAARGIFLFFQLFLSSLIQFPSVSSHILSLSLTPFLSFFISLLLSLWQYISSRDKDCLVRRVPRASEARRPRVFVGDFSSASFTTKGWNFTGRLYKYTISCLDAWRYRDICWCGSLDRFFNFGPWISLAL